MFVADEGVVDVALVATAHKARSAEELRHPGWVCQHRKDHVLVDISDGVVRTDPLYLVYQRGSARVPITAIRVIASSSEGHGESESD